MDLFNKANNELLLTAAAGRDRWDAKEMPTVEDVLELMMTLDAAAERRHDAVVEAIRKRDGVYKQSVLGPIYKVKNMKKAKQIEKHFEDSAKEQYVPPFPLTSPDANDHAG